MQMQVSLSVRCLLASGLFSLKVALTCDLFAGKRGNKWEQQREALRELVKSAGCHSRHSKCWKELFDLSTVHNSLILVYC